VLDESSNYVKHGSCLIHQAKDSSMNRATTENELGEFHGDIGG
jgi:hypothetical protein